MTTVNFWTTTMMACVYCTLALPCAAQQDSIPLGEAMHNQRTTVCSDNCAAKNQSNNMTCKLTTPELRERKETVIANLKRKLVEKRELKNGYAFRFAGSDDVLDELTEFIKTERECCDFFIFGLSVSGDKSEAWLELTGADGAKDFMVMELGL